MEARIDRASPLPLYYQLKQIILAEIEHKGLVPGDRLLGDHLLCETYGVSRTVARQALADLEAAGAVERIKGRGTFVAEPTSSGHPVRSLTGLFDDVAARGSHLHSDVRRMEVVPAEGDVADSFQLKVGSALIVIERLRFVDDEPWALTVSYVPYDVAPGLLSDDLTEQSLYGLLEAKYGVALERGRRSVDATVAGRALARSLNVKPGAAVLVLRSLSFDRGDRPVELFVAYHRGDRSRFEFEVQRSSSSGLPAQMVVTA
jgi:GntR family transcriptional regulator